MTEPVVVDTNVILSATIADSKTRELVVNLDQQLVAPEAIHAEIGNYRELITEKSGLSGEELDTLLNTLFKYIKLVPDNEVREELGTAERELEGVDMDDAVFLAAALSSDGVIWSDDKDLQEQDLVTVYTTSEIVDRVENP
jgi:predicted nucleic acid-binding protein